MATNYVEKRNGEYQLVNISSRKILAKDSDLEKFVYSIKEIQMKGNLEGGVYTGVPTETDDEYLNKEEHDLFWNLYRGVKSD